MSKRILFPALLLLCLLCTFARADGVISGEVNGLKWTIDQSGTLSITGRGEIPDFDPSKPAPWSSDPSVILRIEVGEGVTRVGNEAFYNCSAVKSVQLPQSLTSIGNMAFFRLFELESIDLPDGVTEIGYDAFSYSKKLQSLRIPKGTVSIGKSITRACESLSVLEVSPENTVFHAEDNCLMQGTSIIAGCNTSVIPQSATRVASNALGEFPGLTQITIPAGLTEIEPPFLMDCYNLRSITVDPQNLVFRVENNCLVDATGLLAVANDTVLVPEEITTITQGAFSNYRQTTTLMLPESVTTIKSNAFSSCHAEKIILPSSLVNIAKYAFQLCFMTEISIPETITSIPERAFYGCGFLRNVYIPRSVTEIATGAFSNCNALIDIHYAGTKDEWKAISIASDVIPVFDKIRISYGSTPLKVPQTTALSDDTIIDYGTAGETVTWTFTKSGVLTFSGSGVLERINAPGFTMNNVTSVVVEPGITEIGYYGLAGYPASNMVLPDTLRVIGVQGLSGVKGETLTLPNSITRIEGYALSSA